MSDYESLPETRKSQIKAAVQRNREKMKSLTPAEKAGHKVRAELGTPDPYTPDERARAEAIRDSLAKLLEDAERLNGDLLERLGGEAERDAGAKALLAAFEAMPGVRVTLKPF